MRLAAGDQLLSLLAEVAQLLVQGHASSHRRPMALRGLTHGFEEAFGCLRAYRRSAKPSASSRATIALELMGSKIQSVLEPIQVGVRTSHGTEGVVHVARQWMNRHSDNSNKVMVLINSVDRSAVLQAVREFFPENAPWADLCYRSPSSLRHRRQHHATALEASNRAIHCGPHSSHLQSTPSSSRPVV